MSPIKAVSILLVLVFLLGGGFLFMYLNKRPSPSATDSVVEKKAVQEKKTDTSVQVEEKRQEMLKVLEELSDVNQVSTSTQASGEAEADSKRQEMINILDRLNAQNSVE